jgi:hypothetical protein
MIPVADTIPFNNLTQLRILALSSIATIIFIGIYQIDSKITIPKF